MNSSSKESLVEIFDTFGLQAENATLLVATAQVSQRIYENSNEISRFLQICSHQMKTDGSGLDQESRLAQPHKEILAIGATPADTTKLNQTTVKQLK